MQPSAIEPTGSPNASLVSRLREPRHCSRASLRSRCRQIGSVARDATASSPLAERRATSQGHRPMYLQYFTYEHVTRRCPPSCPSTFESGRPDALKIDRAHHFLHERSSLRTCNRRSRCVCGGSQIDPALCSKAPKAGGISYRACLRVARDITSGSRRELATRKATFTRPEISAIDEPPMIEGRAA